MRTQTFIERLQWHLQLKCTIVNLNKDLYTSEQYCIVF